MSRALALVIAIALLIASATTALASDFRGSEWGATQEAVKAKEKLALASADDNEVVYDVVIGKMAGEVRYKFGPKGFYEALILSKQPQENAMDYIGDYVRLHEIVTRAHGNPIIDETRFSDESKRSDPDAWPDALKSGVMVMEAKWTKPRTTVTLRLGGVGGVIALSADFVSATIKEGSE